MNDLQATPSSQDSAAPWIVLINEEEQYGLFPAELPLPAGWREAGFRGTEEACMAYVDQHWTDMRPASLRRAMDATAPR